MPGAPHRRPVVRRAALRLLPAADSRDRLAGTEAGAPYTRPPDGGVESDSAGEAAGGIPNLLAGVLELSRRRAFSARAPGSGGGPAVGKGRRRGLPTDCRPPLGPLKKSRVESRKLKGESGSKAKSHLLLLACCHSSLSTFNSRLSTSSVVHRLNLDPPLDFLLATC